VRSDPQRIRGHESPIADVAVKAGIPGEIIRSVRPACFNGPGNLSLKHNSLTGVKGAPTRGPQDINRAATGQKHCQQNRHHSKILGLELGLSTPYRNAIHVIPSPPLLSVPLWRFVRPLLEFRPISLLKFLNLWCDHHLAVGLPGVFREIILVIGFGFIEFFERDNLRYNGSFPRS
jgi:hypothetical protein